MTRVWTRRSIPGRLRSAGTLTSRRLRSFPLRVIASPRALTPSRYVSQARPLASLDFHRSDTHAVALVGALRHLEASALAPGPEAHEDGVRPRGRRHERHVGLGVVADILARQPEG